MVVRPMDKGGVEQRSIGIDVMLVPSGSLHGDPDGALLFLLFINY